MTSQVAAALGFIGLSPNTSLVGGLVELDSEGFVLTDAGLMARASRAFSLPATAEPGAPSRPLRLPARALPPL